MGKLFIKSIGAVLAPNIINQEDVNYITIENAFLRIRLDNNFDCNTFKLTKDTVNFNHGLVLVNGRKNMNPYIIAAKKDNNNILYITIDKSYKILDALYAKGSVCMNSFNTKDVNSGAVITFNKKQKEIMTVYVEKDDKIEEFVYNYRNNAVNVVRKEITDSTIIAKLKKPNPVNKKSKLLINISKPFTQYYLTTSNAATKLNEIFEKNNNFRLKDIKILTINNAKDLDAAMKTLVDNKIKVITEYGYVLPLENVRQAKLSVFVMNDNGVINCIKSN